MTGPPPDRCGTELGYMIHVRQGTPKCVACKRAHAERRAAYRRRRYLNHAPLSVDATGTRRRLQALAAIGWSLAEQSRRLGWHDSTAHSVAARKWVWIETAEKVRALYDELAMTPGTNKRASNDAARKGWPPPLAWSDEELDDPNATPATLEHTNELDEVAVQRAMGGGRVTLSQAERAEAVRRLTALGLSATEVAARMSITTRTVTRLRKSAA